MTGEADTVSDVRVGLLAQIIGELSAAVEVIEDAISDLDSNVGAIRDLLAEAEQSGRTE